MAQAITGNRIPLYQQVVQSLKQGIRQGKFQVGKLSEEYGVSIRVIQQAVSSLREDRTITHPGRSMSVAPPDSCKKNSLKVGLVLPFFTESFLGQQAVQDTRIPIDVLK